MPIASAQAQAVDAGVSPPTTPDATSVPDTPDAPDAGSSSTPLAEPTRAAEEAELAAEMARMQSAQPPAAAEPSARSTAGDLAGAEASGASGSSRGLSNLMNPAISAVGITLAGGTTRGEGAIDGVPDDLRTGIFIQEIELRASAIVDPFFRADVSLAGSADEIAFEEAYLTTLELPRVSLRAGQMKATVGRHNLLHTHAFPFITAPLPWRALIGPEGLNDAGVSADLLLPLPFYAELTGQVFSGEWAPLEGEIPDDPLTSRDESVPDRRHDRDLAYVGHAKTLFDLSDATTLELGGSYVGGRNGFGGLTHVIAGDVTLKWKPLTAERYQGFDWTTEYVWVKRGQAPSDRTRGGGYTALRYQFAQQWWVQARGALLGLPAGDSARTLRGEALVAFVPSEFSALRLQYALEKEEHSAAAAVHEVFAQLVFSVGPHPAHAY
jgi:hypothetical protein